ncbi:hypothetical protein O6H91_Y097700 [Diphasiastrum complanatum]|nr:hypothetical protein O6H91_Y097700 [Diphasiastrum complanatum]
MKRGTLILDRKKQQQQKQEERLGGSSSADRSFWLAAAVQEWISLLAVWQYSIPFALNLSASLLFFVKLGDSPLSLAVPVTNATTFAMTAVAGAALGERSRISHTLFGLFLIVLGIVLCLSPSSFQT